MKMFNNERNGRSGMLGPIVFVLLVLAALVLFGVFMANAQGQTPGQDAQQAGTGDVRRLPIGVECPGECTDLDIAKWEAKEAKLKARKVGVAGVAILDGQAGGLKKARKGKQATKAMLLKALVKASELQAGLNNVDAANEIVKQIEVIVKGMSAQEKEFALFELIGMFK